jgi:predicted O-linked N-acetylglucosamine transferase (SPINDLY family)
MQTLTDAATSIVVNSSIQSSEFYEAAIAANETTIDNYWYLGISYLLSGREDDAQAAWFIPLSVANPDEIDDLTNDLLLLLEREADFQAQIPNLETAWLLRQHLWSLAPDRVINILKLLGFAIKLDLLTPELLVEWQLADLIATISIDEIDRVLLESTISILVEHVHTDLSLEIIESCLQLFGDSRELMISRVVVTGFNLFYQGKLGEFAVKLAEVCKSLSPNNLEVCQALVLLCSDWGLHSQSIANAEQYTRLVSSPIDKLFGSYMILRASLAAGDWQHGKEKIDRHFQSLQAVIQHPPHHLNKQQLLSLITSSVFIPYSEDNPQQYRYLQNQIAAIYQENINNIVSSNPVRQDLAAAAIACKTGVLRIGYLASTLKAHSVGWLTRWLFKYHDRASFQVFIYCVNQNPDDGFHQQWFRDKVDISYYFHNHPEQIADRIKADNIDILIDLDSLTLDISCFVMAYKPAPIQISWLGWDATGLPSIDYFIADPYVLPDDAQDYYSEKIWRLPQTYLGVEGFEVGIPTLRREDLNIPADAVVYFSSQIGYKRHPDCIKAQMEIIKAVPNSYFLIKGKSDAATIQDFFSKLAAEVEISMDRIRFLPQAADEVTHRANLAIADIVLDTFPYNGATTTLETLWMGIPMVTQVGQQFAARNSYTFMLNAGIEEGIAWSQAEYIEWGVKLGLDRDLRDQIAGKLRSGRTTAPVWNAKQFTLDLEQAYRDMWTKYQAENRDRVSADYSHN